MSTYLPLFLVLLLISPAWTLDNGAALLPPLVVTTQLLGCNINENSLRNIIDQIIELGLKRAGFDHLLIYDCWQVNCRGFREKEINRQEKWSKIKVVFLQD